MTTFPIAALGDLLVVLARHEVQHVVIGGVAVGMHGAPRATKDLDIVPLSTPENLARLWDALASIDARPKELEGFRPEELPLPWSLRSLVEGQGNWILETTLGRIDVMQWVAPFEGYDDLIEQAEAVELEGAPLPVRYAGLHALIAMKQEAGRPQDLIDITALRLANGLEA